jgi:hypothetical protein
MCPAKYGKIKRLIYSKTRPAGRDSGIEQAEWSVQPRRRISSIGFGIQCGTGPGK